MSSLTRWVLAHKRIVVIGWIALTIAGIREPVAGRRRRQLTAVVDRQAGTHGEAAPAPRSGVEIDEILVAAAEHVSPERLVRELDAALPASLEVRTGAQAAQQETQEVTAFTDYVRYFLLGFAGIALFVGAFVIFNTLDHRRAAHARARDAADDRRLPPPRCSAPWSSRRSSSASCRRCSGSASGWRWRPA
jgi:hypothetical protein